MTSILEPVYRALAQPSYASRDHSDQFIEEATGLGPNGKSFQGIYGTPFANWATAGPVQAMYDGITPSLEPDGAPVYAGYYNGSFANMGTLRADHPGAKYIAVTPNGDPGADYLDVEPGDATNAEAPAFWHAKGTPDNWAGFYTSAGNAQAFINTMSAAGIPRGKYGLWTAHWTGYHICGPATCGYPAADATQYASNADYDTSAISSTFWAPVVSPVTNPVLPKDWQYEAPGSLSAKGGHTSVRLYFKMPVTAVGGAKTPKNPDGYQVDIYSNPVQRNADGTWKLVETRYFKGYGPGSVLVGGLSRYSAYIAHIWAVGSPVSSQAQYASVDFQTG